MSFFKQLFESTESAPATHSNVIGATGLSRASLGAYYRRNGLFGADSTLSAAEQAIVQSRAGLLPGVAPKARPARLDDRLQALDVYAEARFADPRAVATGAELALREAGFSDRAVAEIDRVLTDVRAVFGARPLGDSGRADIRYAQAA